MHRSCRTLYDSVKLLKSSRLRKFLWLFVWLSACALMSCQSFPPGFSPNAARTDADGDAALPRLFPARESQFIFESDVKLSADLLKELGEEREQVFKELKLPHSNRIVQVYIFENQARYERFIKNRHPELPDRRAFFLAQPRGRFGEDLLVYCYWNERIQQDLRHELTHAMLHSVLKGVPMWLDEGLAENYEVAPAYNGVNYPHLVKLRDELDKGRKLDLARLEQLTKVQEMKQPEYREAWAWVHFMLHSTPKAKQVLLQYLQTLRTNPQPNALRPALAAAVPNLDAALERHLAGLDPTGPSLSIQR